MSRTSYNSEIEEHVRGQRYAGWKNGMDMVMSGLDIGAADYEEQARNLLSDKSSAIIMLGTELLAENIELLNRITNPFVVIDYWNGEMSFNSIQINNKDSVKYRTGQCENLEIGRYEREILCGCGAVAEDFKYARL